MIQMLISAENLGVMIIPRSVPVTPAQAPATASFPHSLAANVLGQKSAYC